MSNKLSRAARSVPFTEYLRAFANRRQNWIVLGRNLIPIVGVYAFDWSIALTVFNYWFDGITAMAAMLAALLARVLLDARRATPATGTFHLIAGGVLIWLILFGLLGIPYWLLLDSAHRVLQLDAIATQIAQTPVLWLTFAALAVSQFWRAFDSGYLSIPENQLKQRGQTDFFALIARAVAMSTIAHVGLGLMLVPLMALALTYIEVAPGVQAQVLERYKAQRG